jgi:hypothetical protein
MKKSNGSFQRRQLQLVEQGVATVEWGTVVMLGKPFHEPRGGHFTVLL